MKRVSRGGKAAKQASGKDAECRMEVKELAWTLASSRAWAAHTVSDITLPTRILWTLIGHEM